MKRVVKIDINDKVYGGRVYENEIVKQLDGVVNFERVYIMKYKSKFLNLFRFVFLLLKYKFFFTGNLLLTNSTTIFAGLFSNNIAIIHHVDSHFSFNFLRFYDYICDKYLFLRKGAFNKIIVVAAIWKELLIEKGFNNIFVIYNSFNLNDFIYSAQDLLSFKEKYNLKGKPIIYLGSGIKGKGADKSYEILKDFDAHFVISGRNDLAIPVISLQLNYSEYKKMLASADVVIAMSEFKEGWNRVVHEASLCGTSVIGSGMGGMKELLEISNQTQSDFEHLKENMINTIGKKYILTEELKSLNLEYFRNSWIKVFSDLQ